MTDFKISQLPVASDAAEGDFIIINKNNTNTSRIDVKEFTDDFLVGKYVKLNGDNNIQTITGTGGLKIDGLLDTANGVRINGGNASDVQSGFISTGSPNVSLCLTTSGETQTILQANVNTNNRSLMRIGPPDSINILESGLTITNLCWQLDSSNIGTSVKVAPTLTELKSQDLTDIRFVGISSQLILENPDTTNFATVELFNARNFYTTRSNVFGYRSEISSGTNRFNFYAHGDATNYFAGDVGIGINNPRTKFQVTDTNGNIYMGDNQDIFGLGQGNPGAIYIGGPYENPTAGIECCWQDTTRPSITVGVTRGVIDSVSTPRTTWDYDGSVKTSFGNNENIPPTFTIRNNSCVGINTLDPTSALDVHTDDQYDGIALRNDNNIVGSIVGLDSDNDNGCLTLYSSSIGGDNKGVQLSAVGDSYIMDQFGVGTATPNEALHVVTTAQNRGIVFKEGRTDLTSTISFEDINQLACDGEITANELHFNVGPNDNRLDSAVVIQSDGKVVVGGDIISNNWPVIETDVTFYVSTSGDDLNGDGSFASPWARPHRAMEYLSERIISDNSTVTIDVAAGVYTFSEPLVMNHPNGDNIRVIGSSPTGDKPTADDLNGGGVDKGNTPESAAYNDNLLRAYFTTIFQFNDSHCGIVSESGGGNFFNNILITRTSGSSGNLVVAGPRAENNSNTSSSAGGITFGTNMAVHGGTNNGLLAYLGGVIVANEVIVTNCGGNNIATSYGGTIYCQSSIVRNTPYTGILANKGGQIDCTRADVAWGNGGISVSGGGVIVATYCKSHNNEGPALYVNGPGRIEAQECEVVDNDSYAVLAREGGNVYMSNSTVSNNGNAGLVVEHVGAIVASGCTISDNDSVGAWINYGGSIVINDCVLNGNGNDGIRIAYGGDMIADKVIVSNSVGHGINVEYGGTVKCINATVTDNGGDGVRVIYGGIVRANGITVTGNVGTGLSVSSGSIDAASSNINNNGLYGVLCSNNGFIQIYASQIHGNDKSGIHCVAGGNVEAISINLTQSGEHGILLMNGGQVICESSAVKNNGVKEGTWYNGYAYGAGYLSLWNSDVIDDGESEPNVSPAYDTTGNGNAYINRLVDNTP